MIFFIAKRHLLGTFVGLNEGFKDGKVRVKAVGNDVGGKEGCKDGVEEGKMLGFALGNKLVEEEGKMLGVKLGEFVCVKGFLVG